VIYEAHVRGFTRHASSATRSLPGTYKALAEKLPYLKVRPSALPQPAPFCPTSACALLRTGGTAVPALGLVEVVMGGCFWGRVLRVVQSMGFK